MKSEKKTFHSRDGFCTPESITLIPGIFFWSFEKLWGLGRRGGFVQDGNRLLAFCGIRILFSTLKVHCDSREDRRMLVATGSTDDEVLMISSAGPKSPVSRHIGVENVSEDTASTRIVSLGIFLSTLAGPRALSKPEERFSYLSSLGSRTSGGTKEREHVATCILLAREILRRI